MKSLFIRNLIFTILQPGLVVLLFPYLIVEDKFKDVFHQSFGILQFAGIIIFLGGMSLILYCIYYFAVEGRGTLSPADPTKNLVVHGPYQLSRNPMYIGVTVALLGEVIFIESGRLLLYTGIVFVMFALFVMAIEEPRLRKDFGDQYSEYCKKVRRWI
ncbi:MAG TPA: isoprenylcysteine carboxylmethyltransferase family protein [Saprospiraceae bacterium]|nr:isoprenylcysteine carboxylmethyltransferase family protein [Saprospiraceae bacterium]